MGYKTHFTGPRTRTLLIYIFLNMQIITSQLPFQEPLQSERCVETDFQMGLVQCLHDIKHIYIEREHHFPRQKAPEEDGQK